MNKIFDWEICKEKHKSDYVALMKKTQNSAITEERFVELGKALGGTQRPPSKFRNDYKTLKRKFGFFSLL